MNKWTGPLVAALLLFLSLWGLWGEGTASKLLPEKEAEKMAVSARRASQVEDEVSIEGDGPVKRYDASLHVRAKPVKDPFHMDAIKKEEKPKALPAKKDLAKATQSKKVTEKEASYSQEPRLRGVMAFGSEKRAVIECEGQSITVKEGESAGSWKVSSIGEKTVTLTGASGIVELSIR